MKVFPFLHSHFQKQCLGSHWERNLYLLIECEIEKEKLNGKLFWRTDWTRWNEIGFIPLTYESLDAFVFKLAWWLVICPAHASWLNLCLHKEGVLLSLSLSQYLIKFFSLIILVRWHSFIFKFNLIPYNQWYTHNNQWLTHNSKFTTAS